MMTNWRPRFKSRVFYGTHHICRPPSAPIGFLSNHGYVLLCFALDPTIRISELADRVGIGERAAQKIIADLVADGYVTRAKDGRRNRYTINREAHLRHPLFSDLPIGPLVDALVDGTRPGSAR